MNSIRNTIFLSPTLNKNLRLNNSKLFLHLKWYLTIMLINFYLNKRFFSAWHHPDSFSRGGECHRPPNHDIGGIFIPPKNGATHSKLVAGVSDNRSLSLDLTATQLGWWLQDPSTCTRHVVWGIPTRNIRHLTDWSILRYYEESVCTYGNLGTSLTPMLHR